MSEICLIDGLLGKNWSDDLGKENSVVVPKIAFDKIPGAYKDGILLCVYCE